MALKLPMPAPMLAIQYLEDSPGLAGLDLSLLVGRIRSAVNCLPISHLLIGWHLPQPLLEACRSEAERLGLRFLRWQPLLTTDKGFQTDPSWYVEGLMGGKVPGYRGLPEFTFFCPNHPSAREAVLSNIQSLARQGIYQGFFLDRVRFPSPANNPIQDLACFCEHCCRKAAEIGLDLPHIRREILDLATTGMGPTSLVRNLLSKHRNPDGSTLDRALDQFILFRQACIHDFLNLAIEPLMETHLEIGLDCFSPSLTAMVGQELKTLGQQVDWIKLMTYGHTNAPAGLPFEFSGLARFLVHNTSLNQAQALQLIMDCTGLSLPGSSQQLERDGLPSPALGREVRQGVEATPVPILAGIELVDLPGVTRLDSTQIRADLVAIKHSAPAGLAISWDLLHIPLKRLSLVNQVYLGNH